MKINIEMEFVEEICCNCSCVFMLPKQLQINLRKTKALFYCYNGHGQSYTKSTAEILKEQLDAANVRLNERLNRIVNLEEQIRECNKPKRRARRVTV